MDHDEDGNVRPKRTDLLSVTLAATPSIDRVHLTRIELAPGQAAGPHHHPCDVVGVVTSGSIRFTLAGGETTVLGAGDPFFEPRNVHVLEFDNAADDRPAIFLAWYLLDPDTTDLIRMSPPPD